MSRRRYGWSVAAVLAVLGAVIVAHPAVTTADDPPVATNVRVNQTAEVGFPQNGQNQPAIAQNPTNPKNLVASSNDELSITGQGTGFYASKDGGLTWPCQGYIDLSAYHQVSFGDAWQTFDGEGNAYLSTIGLPPLDGSPLHFDTADVFVSKSADGGCSYAEPVKVASNSRNVSDDKPSIAADASSSSRYANNVYVAWTQYKGAAAGVNEHSKIEVVVARSTDGGASWSKPVGVSAETTPVYPGIPPRQGANVQVGPDGAVYVTWADTIDYMFVQQIAVSHDGGKTFSKPVTVAPILDDFSAASGSTFRPLGRILPSFDIASDGTLYLAWGERSSGHAVAVLTHSTDGGATWSEPTVAADVKGRSVAFASVAAGAGKAVHVVVTAIDDVDEDTAPGAGVVTYDAYAAHSSDGGLTFGAPTKISTASSDPDVSSSHSLAVQFLGDYIMAVADGSNLYAVWTDTRNGAPCAVVDKFRLGAGPPPTSPSDCPANFGDADIYLGIVPLH